jgi:hypothetical protein
MGYRNEEQVHEEERDGYKVRLYLAPEDHLPDWDFESEEDKQETLRKIDQGLLLWFCAHVVAEDPQGNEGDDYLGGCCYKSVQDFTQPGDYYSDMVHEAISRCASERAKNDQRRAFL